ncbi:ATP-binding protein [Vulcanisaeta distributa]|uniref:ATP-binding protein n=1 Tax=Vulcanisaeta distributa TaxID=164451 RepID=UPI00069A50BB|nr:ATP-binding protein [Vulcanisaeta distributa]
MGRVRLGFANLTIEFVDRDLALKLIDEWAEKSTFPVQVIYGPEGCGKTAWLLQSIELLKDHGFEVVYVNPINRLAFAEVSINSLREEFFKLVKEAIAQSALARIAWIAYNVVYDVIKATRGKVAVIVDDAFQVIGVKESALYVKALLNLIEYPPEHYEKIVTIAATSEGVSRYEIGRHRWASIRIMWNMPKEGFRQLYEQLPGGKPPFEEVWRITGGNPAMLESLYRVGWSAERVLREIIARKNLHTFTSSLGPGDREVLVRALEDPDALMSREGIPLMNRLIELNLIINVPPWRDEYLWVDQPPPEKDEELGIGKYVAWQSPLHREAVRRVLGMPG